MTNEQTVYTVFDNKQDIIATFADLVARSGERRIVLHTHTGMFNGIPQEEGFLNQTVAEVVDRMNAAFAAHNVLDSKAVEGDLDLVELHEASFIPYANPSITVNVGQAIVFMDSIVAISGGNTVELKEN